MNLLKVLFYSVLLVLPVICMGNTNKHMPLDTVEITTFRDTVYSSELPAIEFNFHFYHNFHHSITVAYNLILRGEEIDINDILLYTKKYKTSPLRMISPFHLHAGDSTDHHRIDSIHVKNKFPFSGDIGREDSVVIVTSKGNFTIYMSEARRAAQKYNPILTALNDELSESKQQLQETRDHVYVVLAVAALICIALGSFLFFIFRRYKRMQAEQVSKLLGMISENEMSNRQLKAKVSDLLRGNFDTLNHLCYEYFEKADTGFLKKSIFTKVEEEIERLKSREQLSRFENVLNEYCDEIILRVKTQIPQLSDADISLLIYLYSGLSARTICVLLDIQLKTFYMRRLRLKTKIESSDAPDREWFISNM